MEREIRIPEVGESVSEVVIAEWLKKDGDYVEVDEPICEIDSDKASFEIPSDESGVLKILVDEGETVAVGDTVAKIDTDKKRNEKSEKKEKEKESSEGGKEKQPQKEEVKSSDRKKLSGNGKVIDVKIPEIGESVTEVVINHWLKADGDYVEKDEPICEIDSDKASFEIPADESGQLTILKKEDETVLIGAKIARIELTKKSETKATDKERSHTEKPKKATEEETTDGKAKVQKISPVAEKILSKAGISPEGVQGSGIGGRITKEDALGALEEAETNGKEVKQKPETEEDQVTVGPKKPKEVGAELRAKSQRTERREKMTTLRKTISKRLVAAKNETAMLTTFNEADMQAIMNLRTKYKDLFKEKYEVNLGYMSFFTRAICNAIKDWPAINAKINDDDIVYHDYCDVSIAVSTPKGLVTPVIRNADKLSLAEIESEVLRLAEKARAGKLSIDEMSGGTFTITNGGVFGSLMATPILNPPQSAILGMHKIMERPVVIDEEIVVRPMMYLALSYDHRIVDGRESVSFLVRVKEMLEDPSRLLLEV